MNVRVLEMPLDFGASRHGSDMGPSAMRLAGLRGRIESLGHHVARYGAPVEILPQECEEPGNPKAKYLEPIVRACEALAREVADAAAAGDFPLVLGGDNAVFAILALVGLALLLAPLWNFLGLRAVVYAVTDLRAIRGSRLLSLSVWGSSTDNRFLRPWLSTDAQGRKNVLFTKVQINNASRSSPHIRYRPDGFHHLSPADADAALAALRVCYAHTEDLRRLNRKTEGPRSGSWQTEEYVEFPRDRVPKGAKSTFGI